MYDTRRVTDMRTAVLSAWSKRFGLKKSFYREHKILVHFDITKWLICFCICVGLHVHMLQIVDTAHTECSRHHVFDNPGKTLIKLIKQKNNKKCSTKRWGCFWMSKQGPHSVSIRHSINDLAKIFLTQLDSALISSSGKSWQDVCGLCSSWR